MYNLQPAQVWDTYWAFAHNRFEMWWDRIHGGDFPWTSDPILQAHRFTNTYRILDRVSQYLVKEVQYDSTRSQSPDELFFRTMLFKFFNKISTWELIERELGRVSWQSFDSVALLDLLNQEMERGRVLYSAAYIIPSPPFFHLRKHGNHIALLVQMMTDGLPSKIAKSSSLEEVYESILAYPGMGRFLAFQYTIDLNYSNLVNHDESTFVVAGPGALDGMSKCFLSVGKLTPEQVIMETYHRQEEEFARLGLPFRTLFGRKLQPIDCQNCYCETSKYTRKSHPDVVGVANRSKIKQSYRRDPSELPVPFFPPKWNLTIPREIPNG